MTVDSIGGSNPYMNIASGSRINSAADDPAGLSISNKMETQNKSSEQNLQNVEDMQSMAQTADGALASIEDGLQRIRELAVQASNGILSGDDREAIQGEVSQILEGINETAKNTEFNQISLLDGSANGLNVSSNTDGKGSSFTIENSSLSALGIEGFDVTGSFSIEDIDNALEKVSESRSNVGSASNAFEYASSNITTRMVNLTESQSRIADADIEEEIMEMQKEKVLEKYRLQMQSMEQKNMTAQAGMLADFKL